MLNTPCDALPRNSGTLFMPRANTEDTLDTDTLGRRRHIKACDAMAGELDRKKGAAPHRTNRAEREQEQGPHEKRPYSKRVRVVAFVPGTLGTGEGLKNPNQSFVRGLIRGWQTPQGLFLRDACYRCRVQEQFTLCVCVFLYVAVHPSSRCSTLTNPSGSL